MLDLIWTKLCLPPTTYRAVVKSGNGALQGAVPDVVQKVQWGRQLESAVTKFGKGVMQGAVQGAVLGVVQKCRGEV